MVILKNKNKDPKLNVEDYGYPFSREYWDSNWLSINIEIKDFKTIFF
ncbi:WapI family immunity protein [Gilliamella sp. G0441]